MRKLIVRWETESFAQSFVVLQSGVRLKPVDSGNDLIEGHHRWDQVRLECQIEKRIVAQLRCTVLFVRTIYARSTGMEAVVQDGRLGIAAEEGVTRELTGVRVAVLCHMSMFAINGDAEDGILKVAWGIVRTVCEDRFQTADSIAVYPMCCS